MWAMEVALLDFMFLAFRVKCVKRPGVGGLVALPASPRSQSEVGVKKTQDSQN